MSQATQATLIEQIQQGDRAALGTLLQQNERRLYNVALRMVSNPDDAAEVTQDAFAKIIAHIGSFRSDAQITTWMTRIVMNQAISLLRRRKLRDHVSLESSGSRANSDDQAATLRRHLADGREQRPDQRVEQDEMLEVLRNAIDRLDEDFRAVLVLRDIEQMHYDEIAQTLELKPGTVKSRLFRARLALRQEMLRLQGPEALPNAPG